MKWKTYFRQLAEDRPRHGMFNWVLKPCLLLASYVYGFGAKLHRRWYEKGIGKRNRFSVPVVSVGNITWGGTGKTPLVEYLGRYFLDRKVTPLILARGYGSDEDRELTNKLTGARLGFGRNRFGIGQKMMKSDPVQVVILDDGFQHWPVERDLDIVAVSAINPFGNGSLIPRGILREPVKAFRRASMILLTDVNLVPRKDVEELKKSISALAPHVSFLEAYHEPLFFYRLHTRERIPLHRMAGARITCFSGIGTPRSFQMLLNLLGLRTVRSFEFCDHHLYSDAELLEIKAMKESSESEDIVTTEKDFFRSEKQITQVLKPLVLKVRLSISFGEDLLHERLAKLVGIQAAKKPEMVEALPESPVQPSTESLGTVCEKHD